MDGTFEKLLVERSKIMKGRMRLLLAVDNALHTTSKGHLYAPMNFLRPSRDMDLGRSIGRPRARLQTSETEAIARDIPKMTV